MYYILNKKNPLNYLWFILSTFLQIFVSILTEETLQSHLQEIKKLWNNKIIDEPRQIFITLKMLKPITDKHLLLIYKTGFHNFKEKTRYNQLEKIAYRLGKQNSHTYKFSKYLVDNCGATIEHDTEEILKQIKYTYETIFTNN